MADYLELLEESLVKKIKVLDEIGEFNLKQKNVFTTYSERPDLDEFDEYIEEKDRLIEELNMLDEGFEALYQRVADTLKTDREANAPRIKRLQDLIREITDKSSSLQAQEAENKKAPSRTLGFNEAKLQVKLVVEDIYLMNMEWNDVFDELADTKPSEVYIEIWLYKKLPDEDKKLFSPFGASMLINGKSSITYTDEKGVKKTLEICSKKEDLSCNALTDLMPFCR